MADCIRICVYPIPIEYACSWTFVFIQHPETLLVLYTAAILRRPQLRFLGDSAIVGFIKCLNNAQTVGHDDLQLRASSTKYLTGCQIFPSNQSYSQGLCQHVVQFSDIFQMCRMLVSPIQADSVKMLTFMINRLG